MNQTLHMKLSFPVMFYKYYLVRYPWAQDFVPGILLVFGEDVTLS